MMMPMAGLVCRSCLTVLPLSGAHWDEECSDPTMDPGLVQAAVERQARRDARNETFRATHPGEWWEVTELLGGVRDVFLRRHTHYFPDGQGFNTTEFGDAVGARCEEGLIGLGWVVQTQVFGTLFGINVFGHIDAHKPDWRRIRDTKIKSQGSYYFQQGRGLLASDEDSAQVSMYEMLARQMGLIPDGVVPELEVRYGAMLPALDSKTKKPLDGWMKTRALRLTEEQILALKPAGSGTSVGENVRILSVAEARVRAGESVDLVAQSVPTSCETMFGKQKCPCYCGVARTCFGMRGADVRTIGKPRIVAATGRWA